MTGWIKVTSPQNTRAYLSIDQLIRVRQCLPGIDFTPPVAGKRSSRDRTPGDLSAANAIIDLTNGMQAVLETPEEVMELIGAAQKAAAKEAVA
jgi:hypothetical protein